MPEEPNLNDLPVDPSAADPVQPEGEEGALKGKRQKSQLQRYKDQRDRALQELQMQNQRMTNLETKLDQVMEQKDPPKSDPNDPYGHVPDEQLRTVVDNPESSQQAALQAQQILNNRAVKLQVGEATDKLREEFQDDVSVRDRRAAIQQKLIQDYGEENLQMGSDLQQGATRYYEEFKERFKNQIKDLKKAPEFLLLSAKLAAEDLGIAPQTEGAQGNDVSNNQPQSEQPSRRRGAPPTQDLQSGPPAGHAERLAQKDALVKKGDTSGAIRSMAKDLYSDVDRRPRPSVHDANA